MLTMEKRPVGGPSSNRWMRSSMLRRLLISHRCSICSRRSPWMPHRYRSEASVITTDNCGACPPLRSRSGLGLRLHIGGGLQQAGQHERHVDADGRRVFLVARELVIEDLAVFTPPGPNPAAHRELFDLLALRALNLVDPDEVADIAHLGPLPLIGLKPADLAAAPVQDVADVVC